MTDSANDKELRKLKLKFDEDAEMLKLHKEEAEKEIRLALTVAYRMVTNTLTLEGLDRDRLLEIIAQTHGTESDATDQWLAGKLKALELMRVDCKEFIQRVRDGMTLEACLDDVSLIMENMGRKEQ